MQYDFDKVIDRASSDSEKWHRYGPGVLPLWVADMDFASPEPVIRALRERVEYGIFGYGRDPGELREVVVDRLQRLYGWKVAPEALMFVPGVMRGVNLTCRATTRTGDGLLVEMPVYPPLHRAPAYVGCTLDAFEMPHAQDGTYGIDFDLLEQAITDRTRVFLLCNPHNPTGRVFRRDELERVADICLRHNVIICSDEIHCDLVFSGHGHVPIASLSPEVAARTVTAIAPSKTFNVAGLSCSILIVPDADMRKRLDEARGGLMPGVNTLGLAAALAAYRNGQEWLSQVLQYLEANRDLLKQYVERYLPGVRMANPEGTYLAWLDCTRAGIEGAPADFFLTKAQVALNDGATFGASGAGFVRLNFACPRSTLTEALQRMKDALKAG